MRQKVNLYQAGIRPQKSLLSGARALLVLAVVICVLAGISLYQQQRTTQLRQRLEEAQATREPLQNRVEELRQKAAQQKDQKLRSRIRELKAEQKARRQLADLISRSGTSGKKDFAPFLRALARQHLPNLWLTEFSITLEGTPTLRLTGRTTVSEQIPEYLLRLSREEVFSGFSFRTLRAERLEEEPEVVEFTLASETEQP